MLIEQRAMSVGGDMQKTSFEQADVAGLQSADVAGMRRASQSQVILALGVAPCYSREVMLSEFPAGEFERVAAIPTHVHQLSMQTVIAHRSSNWRLLVSAQFDASDGFRCARYLSIKLAPPARKR